MKNIAICESPSDLLTAEEVGRRLRLPLSTVYHLAKCGKLPAIQLGRSWRFPATSIDRLGSGTAALRVLVVDDDVVTRGLVSSGLEPCGCKVSEAATVEQALQFCQRQRFDALFIDLIMPGRDGIELIRELQGDYTLNQMVVITSHDDVSQAGALLELGPITLMRKPLSLSQLVACLNRVTGSQLVAMA